MRQLIAGLLAGVLIGATGVASAHGPRVTKSCGGEGGPEFFPCAYDARHEGNGRGRSYVLKHNGDSVYVPHWVAHRLRHR